MTMITELPAPPWEEIDPFIEAYERLRGSREVADLGAFLPEPSHEHYLAVLRELVRADLEFSSEFGRPRRVEDYLAAFPMLAQDRPSLEALTFEEYRLRRQAGEHPAATEYQGRFGADSLDWPLTLVDNSTLTEAGAGEFPPAGQAFLDFHLLEEIGRGTFARVYLARQGELSDRPVVLKLAHDAASESRSLAQLQHTNIAPIYSAHRSGSLWAICMPYFGRTTLADILKELHSLDRLPTSGRWLSEVLMRRRNPQILRPEATPEDLEILFARQSYVDAVLWIGSRLADGLSHAHQGGILHQDLKPANILLGDDGQPMILDFNLARETHPNASAGVIGGTLPYMAPEQVEAFRTGRSLTEQRSDIYSLGLILFELLTGRLVSVNPVVPEGGPPRLRVHNPAVTPAVESIVRHCLEPDPANRYQSAKHLREDLERHLADLPLRWASEPSLAERARKWTRRHPRLAGYALAIAALMLLIAVTGYCSFRGAQFANEARLRDEREARSKASDARRNFAEQLHEVRLLLGGPAPGTNELSEGIGLAGQALARYGIMESDKGNDDPDLALLPDTERAKLKVEFREMLLLLSRGQRLLALRADGPERTELFRQASLTNKRAESCASGEEGLRSVLFQRAVLEQATGQEKEARELLGRAEAMPLRTARDHYLVAVEQMARGDFRSAVKYFHAARRIDSKEAFVHYALGICHAQMREYHQAAAALDAGLALRPDSVAAHHQRGRIHHELGEYSQAIDEFGEALRLRPGDTNALIDRALAKLARKDLFGAEKDLTAAIEAGTQMTRVYFIRSQVRQRRGDQAGAAADRAIGLKREPKDEVSWVARGVARMADDPKGALADFESALRLNSRYLPALEDKAAVLSERLDRAKDAVEALSAAIRIVPTDGQLLAGRGVLLARLGERKESLRDAREAERVDPRPSVLYQTAGIYALNSAKHAEDRAEALRLLQAALRKDYGFDLLAIDPDLKPLHDLQEYRKIVEAARGLRTPVTAGGEKK